MAESRITSTISAGVRMQPNTRPPEKKSRPIPPPPVAAQEDDDIEDVTPVKSEPGGLVETHYQPEAGAVALEDTYQEQDESYDYEAYDDGSGAIDPSTGMPYADGNKELDEIVASKLTQILVDGKKLWQCSDCDYVRERKSDLTKHIERRHSDLGVSCEICSSVHSSRQDLKVHMKNVHYYSY